MRGQAHDVKLVDFGIARFSLDQRPELTATGLVLGTPGYMAPEQVRGAKDLDGSADVFSLGCVLFKCLTGKSPFVADNVVGVLAKILLEEAPRVADRVEGIPGALDDLVARMLAKDPAARPDEVTVSVELERLRTSDEPQTLRRSPEISALGGDEQRVWSVVLVRRPNEAGDGPTLADSHERTLPELDRLAPSIDALREVAAEQRGRLEALVDGSLLVTIEGTATDMAAHAARCALALRARITTAPMALATGRATAQGRLPIGEVTDRAARMLDSGWTAGVRIDDATAGLLDSRFEVTGDGRGLELSSEREPVEQPRTLLGRTTPFVGREREIATVQGTFDECVAEPIARCVLLLGPAGIGKSRIIHELVPKLEASGAVVWTGRGDLMGRGSALGLLAPSIRREAGVLEGEAPAVRQRKVAARVARRVAAPMRARVAAFLGDLIGADFPDDYAPEVRPARADVLVRGDQIRRAWLDFVEAELEVHPVVLVLEHVQWGDMASFKLIELALKNLRARPFFVLGAARPEVRDAFPGLWDGQEVQELALSGLRTRASERLVRAVLGEAPTKDAVARMVDRAGGNAFYLEEIVRAVAGGRGSDSLPDTVLAMVQARLDVVDADLRRVLRAASVFGQVFWAGGVAALLAAELPSIEERLAELEHLEIIHRVGAGKFPREADWTFHQAVVRDAAYAMLTEADRTLGHRLAALWLEHAGEREPIVLAEHFERGAEPARAIDWYMRGAQQALGGNDFAGAIGTAERGVECGASGTTLGMLRLVQAEAQQWRGEYAEMSESAFEAQAVLPRRSDAWYTALAQIAVATGSLGNATALVASTEPLFHDKPRTNSQVAAWDRVAAHFATCGRLDLAKSLWDAIEGVASDLDSPWIHRARGLKALFEGDPAEYASFSTAAADAFERSGDLRQACQQRSNAGDAMKELGDYAVAEATLRKALLDAERMGLTYVATHAKLNLAAVLARAGTPHEAVRFARAAVEEAHAQNHPRFECAARAFLVLAHHRAGELEDAERAAAQATELAQSGVPPWVPFARALQAAVDLARDRPAAALSAARDANDRLLAFGAVEEGEAFVRLVVAEALEANHDRAAAKAAVGEARVALLARAERIRDLRYRKTFLENISEHARTIELARAWGA